MAKILKNSDEGEDKETFFSTTCRLFDIPKKSYIYPIGLKQKEFYPPFRLSLFAPSQPINGLARIVEK
jgi:hypothetical protein